MPEKPARGHITSAQRHKKQKRESTVAAIKAAPTLDPTPRIDTKANLKARERAGAARIASTKSQIPLQAYYDDVVHKIRGDNVDDPLLANRIFECSRMIVAAQIDELKQPKHREIAKYADKVFAAADVLLSLLASDDEDETPYSKLPHFILIYGNDLPITSQLEFIEYLRDLRNRVADMKKRFSEKSGGPGRAWSRTGAPSARKLTVAIIIEAWSIHRGKKPSSSNVEAWEAADQLWHASDGPKLYRSEDSDASYERWRRSFETASKAKWEEMGNIRRFLKPE
jgi:hypothetical protein